MTVTPEYLGGFAVVLLVFAASTGLALPFAARMTGHRGLGIALCLAPAIGSMLLIAAGLAAYRFPVVAARPFIALGALLLLGGWFWIRDRRRLAKLPRNWIGLGAGLAISLAFWFSAQANRLSLLFLDEPIHLGLTATIIEGNYPVRSPWSPDLAAAYHYAGELHAAILTSATGLPVWIAAELQHPWLALGLGLAVFGVVLHATRSRIGAFAAAVLAAYSPGIIMLGWPALGVDGAAFPDSLAALGDRFAEIGPARYELSTGPSNLVFPQRTLGFTLLTLLVHSWTLRPFRRISTAVAFGAAVGLLAVVELGVFAIGLLALAAAAGAYLLGARGRRGKALGRSSAALALAVTVALFAGGPVTDTVFGPAATGAGRSVALQVGFSPDLMNPVVFEEPAPGTFAAAVGLRWIHLAILAAGIALLTRKRLALGLCGVGIAGGVLFQSVAYTVHDDASRLVTYSSFYSAIAVAGFLPGIVRRMPAALAVAAGSATVAFALLPTLVPELTPAVRLTGSGVEIAPLTQRGLVNRLAERSRYALEFDAGERIFAWIRDNTPADARILSPWPSALTIATGRFGVFAPTGAIQNEAIAGPEFIDAWSSLAMQPITALGVHYLHVTADAVDTLNRQGIRIEETGGFRLLFDTFDEPLPERRHRMYEVLNPQPSEGVNFVSGLSRRLRADSSVFMGDALSKHAAAALAYELRGHTLVRTSPVPGHIRVPLTVERPSGQDIDYAIFPEWHRPVELNLTQDDAVWHGAGSRLYDLSTERRWRGPVRGDWTFVESEAGEGVDVLAFLPLGSMVEIDRGGELLRVDGRGGLISTSIPASKGAVRIRAINDGPAPFVMYRPSSSGAAEASGPAPGIAYQAGWDGVRVVVDLWWLSAGVATEDLGVVWRIAPSDGGPPDTNDASVRGWEAGLSVRAESDLIREFFALTTLTPGYFDPRTREPVIRDPLEASGGGSFVAYLYVVTHTAETRTVHLAVPVFRFETGAGEPTELYGGVAALEPLDRPEPVWLWLK